MCLQNFSKENIVIWKWTKFILIFGNYKTQDTSPLLSWNSFRVSNLKLLALFWPYGAETQTWIKILSFFFSLKSLTEHNKTWDYEPNKIYWLQLISLSGETSHIVQLLKTVCVHFLLKMCPNMQISLESTCQTLKFKISLYTSIQTLSGFRCLNVTSVEISLDLKQKNRKPFSKSFLWSSQISQYKDA